MTLGLIAILPFLGALTPAVTIRFGRNLCALVCGLFTLTALVLILQLAPAVLAGGVVQTRIDWLPSLGLNLNFMLDGLGLLFAVLILGIGLLIILYARFYLADHENAGQFFCYLMLFQGAMLGIVLSDNILLLLVFWELTSLSSFLLIGYWRHRPEARRGALMALTVTGLGGLALIAGALLLGQIAGSHDLSQILQHRDAIQASPLYLPALILILLGCFTKSAQFPFHFWLPHAMAAPTPVSAYLHSATMVKAGLFLMARLWPVLAGTDAWFQIVTTVGLVTMLLGAWVALFKDDLKALLAYSTVSHLGLITLLLGIGTPAAALAAVFHILNHAVFKAALFMTAGIVDHATHTRDVRRLGGLATAMPVSATLAMVAGLSMAGVPLLNGFLSKELLLEAASETGWFGSPYLLAALVTLSAVLAAAYSFRFILRPFFSQPRETLDPKPHEAAFGLWLAPAVLAVLVVLIGVAPDPVAGPLVRASAGAVTGAPVGVHLAVWHGLTTALALSAVALAGGAAVMRFYPWAERLWRLAPLPEAGDLYERLIVGMVQAARRIAGGLHNGALGRYLAVLAATVLAAAVLAFGTGGYLPGTRPATALATVPAIGWLLMIAAVAALLAAHRNRLVALVLVAVVGLIVSLGFLYFSAPDLALTQISVEVVTVVLMLLALGFLPDTTPRESRKSRRIRDAALAIIGGLGVGALTLAILSRDMGFVSIAGYHLENAYKLGGGTNVVNVTLVDFRGYDTYGEIIVLGIAALIIFALTEALLTGPAPRSITAGRVPDAHPVMMVVVTRLLLPVVLLVGVFLFLRGHNDPGGGFVAGLVVSVGLVMQYMASGLRWTQSRERFDHHALIGAGVVVAGLTGIGSAVFARPFLTSSYGYFTIWPFREFELATAMFFDLGVFLTVLGAVMLALASLGRIARYRAAAAAPQER